MLRLFVVAVVTALAGCHSSSPLVDANNSPIRGANLLIHAGTNEELCIDAQPDPAEENRMIRLFHCHGRENQRWTFADQGDGSSEILGMGGQCLDIQGGGTAEGTPLQLHSCTAAPHQKFRHLIDGRLQEIQSGKCLTVRDYVEKSPVVIDRCSEKPEPQAWVISPR